MILLGIFLENGLLNVLISMLVIIFIAGIGFYGLDKAGAFPMKGWVYGVFTVVLIVLLLWFIGALPN